VLHSADIYAHYAKTMEDALRAEELRTTTETRAEKIDFKIREARKERIPYILVVGEKEAADGTVSLRSRAGEEGATPLDQAVERISKAARTRENDGATHTLQ